MAGIDPFSLWPHRLIQHWSETRQRGFRDFLWRFGVRRAAPMFTLIVMASAVGPRLFQPEGPALSLAQWIGLATVPGVATLAWSAWTWADLERTWRRAKPNKP